MCRLCTSDVKELFLNSKYCLDPDCFQSWELSENFFNNTQQQLLNIKTICYQQIFFNGLLYQAQCGALTEERMKQKSGSHLIGMTLSTSVL